MTSLRRPRLIADRRPGIYMVLTAALILRLLVVVNQDHAAPYRNSGGDSVWYLANGYALVIGMDEGSLTGYGSDEPYPIGLRNLPTPPLYLLFIGFWQAVLPPSEAVLIIRLLQALMGVGVCFFGYRLARLVTDDERAGLIAALLLAVSPAYVVEAGQIATESLFIFLATAGLWLYLEYGLPQRNDILPHRASRGLSLLLAAVLLGLATLTRAVLLLFPLALAAHLLLVVGLRRGMRWAALLLLVYGMVVATWTLYNLARWDRWVIGGEGFAAFFFIGASEQGWQGPSAVDEALQEASSGAAEDRQQQYSQAAGQIIASDPAGYVRRRISDLVEAVLQPHGTLFYSGKSLRDLALDWLQNDRSLSGLVGLTQGEAFWPKLALYVFHYGLIIFGLVGLWLYRQRWRVMLALASFVFYLLAIHLLLTALPRYLFPGHVVICILAAAAFAHLLHRPD